METVEIRWRIPSIFWLPLIICLCLLFIVDVFQLKYYTIQPTRVQLKDFLIDETLLKGFLIKTRGCRIPYMDPYDHSIKSFIKKPKPTKCNRGLPALIESNLTSIFILDNSLIDYKIDNTSLLNCCYQVFRRKIPNEDENDNKIEIQTDCIQFRNSTIISDEFIKVKCSYDNTTIYKDFFSFVPIKKEEIKSKEELNVLVIGIDAVSRLNFHRQMPKTVDYLLKNISGIELLGYNKVADNTFPNLIPVLTGLDENELVKKCWPNSNKKFDKCPFIWNDFKKKGYRTSFGEDAAWMGLFNYQKMGFVQQPTDYMWGIFNIISEQQIGNSHKLNVYECVGARNVYKVFLDYIYNFSMKMNLEKLPYFGFYWGSSLSHDILNRPNIGDDDYFEFFYKLKTQNLLNNTVLIVMSDHGIRWGSIRQTFQGRMEERLPFLFFILPDWFKIKYQNAYHNLKRNTRRLTTPFDLHETFKYLLNYRNQNLTKYFAQNNTMTRGYSLFTEISPKRTCEDAGISSHWCTCQESTEIAINETSVIKASLFAVQYINSLLKGYRQCANLTLLSVLNARIMTHGDHIFKGDKTEDYMITLKTLPNDAVFETTVRFTPVKRTYHLEIIGTISRLNLYGQQSACITDFHLKLYCYCKSLM